MNPPSDLGLLKLNVDKLVESIHKSADIQVKLPVKIQSGSATRAGR